jgi:hypothetical protein
MAVGCKTNRQTDKVEIQGLLYATRLLSSSIAARVPFSLLKLLVQQAANFVDESHQLRRVLLCRGSFAQLLPKLIVLTFQLVGTPGMATPPVHAATSH